ncbi:hypothetical protein ACX3YD_30540 [Pseudomonas fluorescens group sp. PF-1]
MPEIGYVTGPDGTARAGLPPGEVSLRFFLPDGSNQAVIVAVGDDEGAVYKVVLNTKGAQER